MLSLDDLTDQDVVLVIVNDGREFEGSYLRQAGMHFVHVRDGSPIGRVEGPFLQPEIKRVERVKSADEVKAERDERTRGETVPGRLIFNREGIQARLERLAAAYASEKVFRRRLQIEFQFNELADRVELARSKRTWMLAEASWRRHSNREPDILDMAGGDFIMAGTLKRPRLQDFDPDPKERRKRHVWPDHVVADPFSPPNMKQALTAAGFKARVSVISELTNDSVALLVDFPGGKHKGRYLVSGTRGEDGQMRWKHVWEGGDTRAALARRRSCERRADYQRFLDVLQTGKIVRRDRGAEPREERTISL